MIRVRRQNLAPPSRDSMPTTIRSGELPEIGQKTSAPPAAHGVEIFFRARGLQIAAIKLARSIAPSIYA
jgi:hypothetical protein